MQGTAEEVEKHDAPEASRPRLRFSIGSLLLVTTLIAVVLSWYASLSQANRKIAILRKRLAHQERVWYGDRDRQKTMQRAVEREKSDLAATGLSVFSESILRRVNFRGNTLRGRFQLIVFDRCGFEDATLVGGGSGFQEAHFQRCKLTNATLTGGSASFQLSSFAYSDLSGATLSGGAASFQGASFEGAKLVGTTIRCPNSGAFQVVNLDGAQFHGADLSQIDAGSLASCVFNTPPRYDAKTRFPVGFDPVEQFWERDD